MQAYRAYFDEGKFIPYEPVTVPKGSQALVMIFDFLAKDAQKANEHGNNKVVSADSSNILRKSDPSKSALGLLEGKAVIPDDFNEPLEDLKEYMY